MPAKNSTLKYGNRDHVINSKFFKEYKEKTGSEISYDDFVNVIKNSNVKIAEIVANEQEGFKLPENLGYIVVTQYKTKKRPTDYNKSKVYDTRVIHNNLHTNGEMGAIRWFNNRINRNFFTTIYKFKGCRTLTRAVSASLKNEKSFLDWSASDFFNHNQVSRLFKSISKRNGD